MKVQSNISEQWAWICIPNKKKISIKITRSPIDRIQGTEKWTWIPFPPPPKKKNHESYRIRIYRIIESFNVK